MLDWISVKQKKVYDCYKSFIENNWYSPTYQEVSNYLWISPSVVYSHILTLEKKWYLVRNSAWRVELYENKNKVPVLWYIACWEPIELLENTDEFISIPESISKKWTWMYSLIAKWDSMIKSWIRNWDYVIIKQQNDVNDWEIWVVVIKDWFDETVTLKRVYHKTKSLLLKPENDDFDSFIINEWWEIRWKLVWVIKNF